MGYKEYKKIDFDLELPPLLVWDITVDAVSMDMGSKQHRDLTDLQALSGLQRLRWKYKARMDYLDREIERLELLNQNTEFKSDENRLALAKAERYFRDEYPRLLDIALAEAGIVVE